MEMAEKFSVQESRKVDAFIGMNLMMAGRLGQGTDIIDSHRFGFRIQT
jgi:hypothetical protein